MASFQGSFIQYLRKIYQKSYITYSLIGIRTCAYQRVRNVRFSVNFTQVLMEDPLMEIERANYVNKTITKAKEKGTIMTALTLAQCLYHQLLTYCRHLSKNLTLAFLLNLSNSFKNVLISLHYIINRTVWQKDNKL